MLQHNSWKDCIFRRRVHGRQTKLSNEWVGEVPPTNKRGSPVHSQKTQSFGIWKGPNTNKMLVSREVVWGVLWLTVLDLWANSGDKIACMVKRNIGREAIFIKLNRCRPAYLEGAAFEFCGIWKLKTARAACFLDLSVDWLDEYLSLSPA